MAQQGKTRKWLWQRTESGQAMMEYALILVLVAVALAAALIATGPALGNVFSNTVINLVGQEGEAQDLYSRGGPDAFWATVTYVAANPPPHREFPANPPQPPPPRATPGPSPTPTPKIDTPTFTNTPTQPPTSTPTDAAFRAEFNDPIDHPEWWRVDNSVWIGGDDWFGTYYATTNMTGVNRTYWNAQIGAIHRYNINFDWGVSGPLEGWAADNFSVRWTRNIYIPADKAPLNVYFSFMVDGGYRLCLDSTAADKACSAGTIIAQDWSGSRTFNDGTAIVAYALPAGFHTLTLEYFDGTGTAGILMDIAAYKANLAADSALPTGPANCQWSRVTGSQPNTVAWAWKESAVSGNGFPPNMRCNLELRGYIDLTELGGAAQMSFWEVWDFKAATTARLQLATYAPYNADGSGGPNWAAGTTITLRSGTGTNYNWTRHQINIPAALGPYITYRYVIESTGAAGVRRWYVDDLRVGQNTSRVFEACTVDIGSCGNYFNMEEVAQKNAFIATGRWDLTNRNTADNSSLSWDVSSTSAGGRYVRFGPEQGTADFRVHALEFNGTISMPYNAADGSGGLPDFEGDEGFPLLSFSHAYDLDAGERLEVQWTRAAHDTTPDNWTTLATLVSTVGSGGTSQPMTPRNIELKNVPNWNTQPFRLRFAMYVNVNNTTRVGWWLDNIYFHRDGKPRYSPYPFCDDVENGNKAWLYTGQWGIGNVGAFGSTFSYTDSPAGNYITGQQTSLELKYVIDFNNDSPENTALGGNVDCAGNPSGPAVRPMMTFWQFRQLGANHFFTVDLYRPANTGTTEIPWTPVWRYDWNLRTRTNFAWEYGELALEPAILQLTGAASWAALVGNANPYDDDFSVRIRLDARTGSGVGTGIFVDNIDIRNYTEVSHKLWEQGKTIGTPAGQTAPAGNGNGTRYIDDVDSPAEWWLRWRNGGDWTAVDWDRHVGFLSFHDHLEQNQTYRHQTYSTMEMTRIIDLRGAEREDNPTLYFWHRYNTGTDDLLRVQIAVEDATRTRQGYNYMYGWGSATSYSSNTSWESAPWVVGNQNYIRGNRRNDAWVREQINLSDYADDPATAGVNEGKRIRVRFLLDALDTATDLRDGWWLDDIRFDYRNPRVYGLPFYDGAQNTSAWVTEGKWGLAPDYWRGSGGGPAALGPFAWEAFYFDCIRWMNDASGPGGTPKAGTPPTNGLNTQDCTDVNTNSFLRRIPRTSAADMDAWVAARPTWNDPVRYLRDNVSDINHDYGTTLRPFGAPTGTAGNTWTDHYLARWFRLIDVLAGDYTFITTSDDGVRARWDTIPGGGAPAGWNLINNWTYHGRTVDIKTVSLEAGQYMVVVDWFETGGDAVIMVQVGNNNFSFSDSPKQGSAGDTVLSIPYSNASMILNGLLNLNNPGVPTTAWRPRIQYYTYYILGSGATAQTEISTDGGFTWTNANFSNNCPSGAQCGAVISGATDWAPTSSPPRDWQLRSHDLRTYVNRSFGLRFRVNTGGDARDGWWITDILATN